MPDKHPEDEKGIELVPLLPGEGTRKRKPTRAEAAKEVFGKNLPKYHEMRFQLNWLLRFGAFVRNILVLAGEAAIIIAKIIPPARALISGAYAIVDLAEAIFISKDDRQRKAVRLFTSLATVTLATVAVFLSLNPLTAPIGIALSAAIMAASALRDAFFWFVLQKDLAKAKIEYVANVAKTSAESQAATDAWTKILKIEKNISERKRSFAYNVGSCIGTAFLALAAFATIGAIIANPVTLVAIGIAILGTAVGIGAYSTYKRVFVKEPKPALQTTVPPKKEATPSITLAHDAPHILKELARAKDPLIQGADTPNANADEEIELAALGKTHVSERFSLLGHPNNPSPTRSADPSPTEDESERESPSETLPPPPRQQ